MSEGSEKDVATGGNDVAGVEAWSLLFSDEMTLHC